MREMLSRFGLAAALLLTFVCGALVAVGCGGGGGTPAHAGGPSSSLGVCHVWPGSIMVDSTQGSEGVGISPTSPDDFPLYVILQGSYTSQGSGGPGSVFVVEVTAGGGVIGRGTLSSPGTDMPFTLVIPIARTFSSGPPAELPTHLYGIDFEAFPGISGETMVTIDTLKVVMLEGVVVEDPSDNFP